MTTAKVGHAAPVRQSAPGPGRDTGDPTETSGAVHVFTGIQKTAVCAMQGFGETADCKFLVSLPGGYLGKRAALRPVATRDPRDHGFGKRT